MRSAASARSLRITAEELLFAAGVVGFATIWFVLRSAISWQVLVVPAQSSLLLVLIVQALPALALGAILVTVRWRGGNVARLRGWLAAGALAFVAAHAAGLGFRHLATGVPPASPGLWSLLLLHTVLLAAAIGGVFWLVMRKERQVTSAFRTLGVLAILSAVVITPALVIEPDERPAYLFAPIDAPDQLLDAAAPDTPPVYVLVLDELSYLALLNPDGAIDADRFPNIARVADEGVLFTNATANYFNTSYALPALVETLTPFTAAGELRVHTQYHEVQAALDPVCGGRIVCTGIDEAASDNSGRTLRHFLVAFAEDLVPAPFSSFARGPFNVLAERVGVPASAADRTALHLYSDELIAIALDGIERGSATNTITVIHSLASHHPFVLEADGRAHDHAYTIHADGYYRANELRFTGRADDVWAIPAGFEGVERPELEGLMAAYLSQLAYGDGVLGDLLDQLEREGLLDESIVIVTSDHGLRQDLRADEPGIEIDQWVAQIPLIVRGPGIAPAVRSEPVQYRDIAATVFDLVDVELATPADTRSAFEAAAGDERQRWLLVSGQWLHYEVGPGAWPTVAELPVTPERDRGPNLPEFDGALVGCLATLSGCPGDLLVDTAAVARLEAAGQR